MLVHGLAAAALSVLVVACGSSAQPPVARARGHAEVAIRSYAYYPETFTISKGTKVTFTNLDNTAHTATADNASFDTGTIEPGKTATLTLDKPGVYTFHCAFHAFMVGRITVRN
jgi:plastocyanin